jgi:hypothetical protein
MVGYAIALLSGTGHGSISYVVIACFAGLACALVHTLIERARR